MPSPEDRLVYQVWVHAYARALAEANVAKQKPQDKGTRAETAVVNWLKTEDYWSARRIVKKGSKDEGDICVCDGVMIQVKDGYTEGREASDYLIGQWLEKVDAQIINGGWEIGLLAHKKAGKGSPADWRWYLSGDMFRKLLLTGDWSPGLHPFPPYVQLQGYMIPQLLRNAGYIWRA